MKEFSKKVILNSTTGYSDKHDRLLTDLIDSKVMLFCAVGEDCEIWHDVMDELIVGNGAVKRDFDMMTTWHPDESLGDVIDFAKHFEIDGREEEDVQIIEV